MTPMALVQVGMAALLTGGAILVLVAGIRHRRHRETLERIRSKHGFGPLKEFPPGLLEKIGRFEGRERKVRLKDATIGSGENSRVLLAQRQVDRRRHALLFFELGGTSHLEGFFVRPESKAKGAAEDLCLHWRAPRSKWNDERVLSMAARTMYNLSNLGERSSASSLGLEIHGTKVWIHSRDPLRGRDLERFADDALRLRNMLLKSLERANDVARKPATKASGAQRPVPLQVISA